MAAEKIVSIHIAEGDKDVNGVRLYAVKIETKEKKTAWIPITNETRKALNKVLNSVGMDKIVSIKD